MVTSYRVTYTQDTHDAADLRHWIEIPGPAFAANSPDVVPDALVTVRFETPVLAHAVRIHPLSAHGHTALRAGALISHVGKRETLNRTPCTWPHGSGDEPEHCTLTTGTDQAQYTSDGEDIAPANPLFRGEKTQFSIFHDKFRIGKTLIPVDEFPLSARKVFFRDLKFLEKNSFSPPSPAVRPAAVLPESAREPRLLRHGSE